MASCSGGIGYAVFLDAVQIQVGRRAEYSVIFPSQS